MNKTEKGELKAFLGYFYFVEQIAQNEGYNTGKRWTTRVRRAHERLMNDVRDADSA